MELRISPEGLELANVYLSTSSIDKTANELCLPPERVSEMLAKPEVKRYIDSVYLDLGYRNRFKLANLLDEIIESKVAEARESEVYTNKDLVDLLSLAHKMRMDELKHEKDSITHQTNVQINDAGFGTGNYGALMEKLLGVK